MSLCPHPLIKRAAVLAGKLAVSLLLVALLSRQIRLESAAETLNRARWEWVLAAAALFAASLLLGCHQWRLLLAGEDIHIPWMKSLEFYFIGLFFNNVLVGGVGGDIFRVIDVRRYSRKGAASLSTVFLDRMMGFFVLSAMAVLAAPWFLFRHGTAHAVGLFMGLFAAGWVLFLLMIFSKKFGKPPAWILKKILPSAQVCRFRDVRGKITAFVRNGRLFWSVTGLSVLIQAARIMTHYMLGRSIGIQVSAGYFLLFIPVIAVISSLPVTFGGIGIREQAGVILFGTVGVQAADASIMEFMAFLVAVATSIPGLPAFVFRKRAVQMPCIETQS
ncbi:flippase-like domain-containing protein [bacterium]|nr:flippase-like domain-containing protein [bacterium]